jgi:hypothetical protein
VGAAQEATPASTTLACLDVATPSVESVMEQAAAFSSSAIEATPATGSEPIAEADLPQGSAADAATVAAVDLVVRTWLACYLAGEELSVLALQSNAMDRGFAALFIDDLATYELVLHEDVVGTPFPIDPRVVISPPSDVRLLDDGRVGGIWALQGDAAFIVFTDENGAWVVDEVIDVLD